MTLSIDVYVFIVMLHFFENIPYYVISPNSNLSFLHPSPPPSAPAPQPTPTFTTTIPSIIPTPTIVHVFVSSPFQDSTPNVTSSFMDVTSTEVHSTTFLSSPGDLPFPHCNPLRDRQPPIRYKPCMTTCYSHEFVPFLTAIHSLQEAKSY